ncbi:hypothetical protein SAMN00120144_1057 [Hymenobacter roseosalivarius DSM 11622]|uniref:Uncharacterized protein n=1 Tax=Hymenobacter roseosalivarius DSM 11622 TaxID=645990 RepID=A0A1W1VYK7_9BACT|nr:hypothetical protein SAMN00120144_1057 [Hymenobacter roseosalivarius DSM 11622]
MSPVSWQHINKGSSISLMRRSRMRYASTWARCSPLNGKPLIANKLPLEMRLLAQTFNQALIILLPGPPSPLFYNVYN